MIEVYERSNDGTIELIAKFRLRCDAKSYCRYMNGSIGDVVERFKIQPEDAKGADLFKSNQFDLDYLD